MKPRKLTAVLLVCAVTVFFTWTIRANFATLWKLGHSNSLPCRVEPTEDQEKPIQSIRYIPQGKSNKAISQEFNVSPNLLQELDVPLTDFMHLDNKTVQNHVFVMGSSANHFWEARDAIASIQHFMPHSKILFYGLDLYSFQISTLTTYCNLEFRAFNFTKYPCHVRNYICYAFKPLIIQECLREFPGCVWFDASIRLLQNLDSIYPDLLRTGGFISFVKTGVPHGHVTDKRIYQYLPTENQAMADTAQFGATGLAFYRTEQLYRTVFYWWVMCALDERCAMPEGVGIHCDFALVKSKGWAQCHRYDQSALNILAFNVCHKFGTCYPSNDVVEVNGRLTFHFSSKICYPEPERSAI